MLISIIINIIFGSILFGCIILFNYLTGFIFLPLFEIQNLLQIKFKFSNFIFCLVPFVSYMLISFLCILIRGRLISDFYVWDIVVICSFPVLLIVLIDILVAFKDITFLLQYSGSSFLINNFLSLLFQTLIFYAGGFLEFYLLQHSS